MQKLTSLPLGGQAYVCDFALTGQKKRRILDLGIIPNTKIEALMKSPSGDPTAYLIRGAVIALRKEDAQGIYIR